MNHRLTAYSTMAIALVALIKPGRTQAIYFNYDPDSVLTNTPDEECNIDMDNNGTIDFQFENLENTGYNYTLGLINEKGVNIFGVPNASIVIFSNYLIDTTTFYASALDVGFNINEKHLFNNNVAIMAFQITTLTIDTSFYLFDGGDWYPEVLDKYVGIRFKDDDDATHYGWIRCSVQDSGRVLIIKDYAYENKPDVGILAGDMIGDTTTAVESLNNTISGVAVYSSCETIFITFSKQPLQSYLLRIFTMEGREVYSNELHNQMNRIESEVPAGIYLVTIGDGINSFNKKIILY